VYDYIINRDGWMLLVKIHSEKMIADQENKKSLPIWKIISERMRLFLSTFVRVTNNSKGRTGCLVHRSYERIYFESYQEAKELIRKIKNQQIKLYNGRKRYRGLKSHYRISGRLGKGSIFLCSKDLKKGELKKGNAGVFDFIGLKNIVLQKLVNSTISKHEIKISVNSTLNPSKNST